MKRSIFIILILVILMSVLPAASFAMGEDPSAEDWLPECEQADVLVFATHPDAGMLKAVCGSDCHSTDAPLPVSDWRMPPYCPLIRGSA